MFLEWDYDADVITFNLEEVANCANGCSASKRNTLMLLVWIFDPLGIVSPITITAKIIVQDMCRLKVVLRPKKQFFFFFGFQNYIKVIPLKYCSTIKHFWKLYIINIHDMNIKKMK